MVRGRKLIELGLQSKRENKVFDLHRNVCLVQLKLTAFIMEREGLMVSSDRKLTSFHFSNY